MSWINIALFGKTEGRTVKHNIIHIVGASGAGTTTLGQALEKEHGYTWLDTDGYFWEKTDPPFVRSLPHEERVKRLSTAIAENPKCVISGSLCGWGDVFIPQFDVWVCMVSFDSRLAKESALHSKTISIILNLATSHVALVTSDKFFEYRSAIANRQEDRLIF